MASPPRSTENDPAAHDGDDTEQPEQPAASTSKQPENSAQPAQPNTWQAIFSTHHNAYYFYNTVTNETTWENPFQAGSSSSASPTQHDPPAPTDTPPAHTPTYTSLQQAALTQGIDPSLAHLDPSLLSTVTAGSVPGANPSFTAKFNARTGTFTRNDARDPSHLSEYERAKRMSEFYFDVAAWEDQRDAGTSKAEEEEGKKRKRPTKKDLERFKEQKRLKKIAKTAWLRQ